MFVDFFDQTGCENDDFSCSIETPKTFPGAFSFTLCVIWYCFENTIQIFLALKISKNRHFHHFCDENWDFRILQGRFFFYPPPSALRRFFGHSFSQAKVGVIVWGEIWLFGVSEPGLAVGCLFLCRSSLKSCFPQDKTAFLHRTLPFVPHLHLHAPLRYKQPQKQTHTGHALTWEHKVHME